VGLAKLSFAMAAFGLSAPLSGHARFDPLLTPTGPASLETRFIGPWTAEGEHLQVLKAVRIVVHPGGRGGRFRLRVVRHGTVHFSPTYTLPAEPGAYTYPVPRVRWDHRLVSLGIEQEDGRHAIIVRDDCRCDLGSGRDRLRLDLTALSEFDYDGDLAGDYTEDRTELRVRARVPRPGHLRVSISNRGPRTADLPVLYVRTEDGRPRCPRSLEDRRSRRSPGREDHILSCPLAPLRAGERRVITLRHRGPALITVTGDDQAAAFRPSSWRTAGATLVP
jgi:hypothetical protein